MTPRVLFVGRTRYRLPLAPPLRNKFDALAQAVEVRVLASEAAGSAGGDERFRLVRRFRVRPLDGLVFWSSLPLRIARELRRFRPDVVVAQSPYEAAAARLARRVARSDARVVAEVHGDWRTATRLYGAPGRRFLAPLADRAALAGLRGADAVRSVSDYTTRLVRDAGLEPAGVFPAFMDLDAFLATPPAELPERPRALFVGVLELYKNIDGLADAWRVAAARVPQAELQIVGEGSQRKVVEALTRALPEQTTWTPRLEAEEVARALDDSTVLLLPSRSEGMGRVVVEAFCRGRPVVASRVGGIPGLVRDGENGLLVEPEDTEGLAAAVVQVLEDRELARRLGTAARQAAAAWAGTSADYAAALRALVQDAPPTLRAD
jgi:glycosyltransferase involved in cell wall biosynthesis